MIQALESDKLITLKIGNNPETSFSVQIQQKVLELASTWFRNALQEDKERQTNVITLTEDDLETWKIALYWIVHHKLPENKEKTSKNFTRIAKCWILGHKHGITGFQDEAMMQLLKEIDCPDIYNILECVCHDLIPLNPPDSMLMRILAEVVVEFEDGLETYLNIDIAELKDNAVFWAAYEKALQDYHSDDGYYFESRMVGIKDRSWYRRRAHWRDYMVGELPAFVHCIRDEE